MYAATIFLSAFLLFLVQPILAKQILPWFGGAASVWTLCMVFFQLVLLLGYAYAHWLAQAPNGRRQAWVHIALLLVSLAFLPMAPGASWKPQGSESPMVRILLLLFATVGLPYLLLSSTSPLVQSWFTRARPGASPYRLFALSNLASMMALLGYPFVVEPWLTNRQQSFAWSAGYALFVVLCAVLAWASRRLPGSSAPDTRSALAEPPALPQATVALWLALAATASATLLGVTNHLSHNISSIPLLWVVPLAIYLLTFILTFESDRWYRRGAYLGALVCVVAVMAWFLADIRLQYEVLWQIAIFTVGLFVVCMFCHGELAARRPDPRHLTLFYLVVSLGGVVGGVLVGIVAPMALPEYLEVEIALVVVGLLSVVTHWGRPPWTRAALVALVIGTAGALAWHVRTFTQGTVYTERNYYGVLRVRQDHAPVAGEDVAFRTLVHGNVIHGSQFLAEKYRRTPTMYYRPTSGIGRTLLALRGRPLDVGVIGLGAGTIAVYSDSEDSYVFYEINPAVGRIATKWFTFMTDAPGRNRVIALGDARLALERQPRQQFDVLAVDAFSGDSIPMHLITVEAVGEYLKHLKPGGIIAYHVSNRFLDLKPVLLAIAQRHQLEYAYVHEKDAHGETVSDWVLLTRNRAFLSQPRIAEATEPVAPRPDWRVWTDDYNNLVQVFRY